MNGITMLGGAIIVFLVAYVTYGSWLAKKWGIDSKNPTPAHVKKGQEDFVPTKSPILLGHHFASIAGAGPIVGPIQAAVFGWIPVFLWIVIGGIFFGGVQDYSSIVVSVKHEGKSLGEIIEHYLGHKCKMLFSIFVWLVLLLVIAAFTDIVASTFTNGAVATASLLFIPLAILFGFFVYRRNAPLAVSSVAGIILLVVCIAIGINFPIHMSKNFWRGFVLLYIFVASVSPVWILLQPRDYLNSFLLYFIIIASAVGILFTNPTITLPAFTGFKNPFNGQTIFPYLFITVACGAISGFHSLVGSGSSSKQLDNEKDAKLVGYGSMLIECCLAIIALIAVGVLFKDGHMPKGNPFVVYASAIAGTFKTLGLSESSMKVAYTVISLSFSAFAITSLDTGARLARVVFQEIFVPKEKEKKESFLTNPYVSTLITVACGGVLCIAGYKNVWPIFGACNQLIAVPCFLAVGVWLAKSGKENRMVIIPMVFMIFATMTSLIMSLGKNISILKAGQGRLETHGIQCLMIVFIFVLAFMLLLEGVKVLLKAHKESLEK
ncbi:MAG: carbon starvation protein A [Fusobacterium sp. JB021]|nr:carbon starvation protein A [Fusobacterium sp. JB021]